LFQSLFNISAVIIPPFPGGSLLSYEESWLDFLDPVISKGPFLTWRFYPLSTSGPHRFSHNGSPSFSRSISIRPIFVVRILSSFLLFFPLPRRDIVGYPPPLCRNFFFSVFLRLFFAQRRTFENVPLSMSFLFPRGLLTPFMEIVCHLFHSLLRFLPN